jgi:amidophosphoribosyltransferase
VKWPCFYGIDFATRAELIANGLDNEGIRRAIGADSLGYVSLPGLIAATEQPKTRLCHACFTGEYPIGLPTDNLIGKHVLEGVGRRVNGGYADHDAVESGNDRRTAAHDGAGLLASPGGEQSLLRP